MDTTTRPGDNFYQYANGNWIKTTEIPSDRPDYWMGTVLYEKSQKNFQKIIDKSQTTSKEDSFEEFLIGSLYRSYIDTTTRQTIGIKPLLSEYKKIDAIDIIDSLTAYFAYATKFFEQRGYRSTVISPIKYSVEEDLHNPQIYVLYLHQSGLGLPDKEFYLTNDKETKGLLKAYAGHIANMFRLAGVHCENDCIADILDLEKSIASYHSNKEETRDYEKQYNPFTINALNTASVNLDWTLFFKVLGISDEARIIVRQPEFIKGIDKLVTSVPLSKWKNYLKWQVLHHYADYLTSDIGQENFRFYGSTLNGIPEQSSLPERGAEIVNEFLGDAVGKIYVKEHFSPQTKARMDSLVSNVKIAFMKRIERSDWMSKDTRAKAIGKLSKMRAQIGYPETWRDYSGIELEKNNLFANIKSLNISKHNEEMSRVGQSIHTSEWWLPPHIPNAYYNQNRNEVVFTAAILQPPLFNLEVDEAVIYGVVGGLIGHEITHGFDDEGGDFDENGALNKWWSESSEEEFNKRSRVLVNQYNAYTVLDSLHINGAFTLGENIADLGSLNIALEAYKLSLKGKEPPVLDGFTGLQRVFLGYAQIWRGKYRDDALRMSVKSGHHSPREFRVNGVVRNIPEFYTLFNVLPEDSLYLPPEQRVRIW
ncbi:M13 family metallopeptidase [bacterium]|nr:M13 family metallopeptidase [bacterium]